MASELKLVAVESDFIQLETFEASVVIFELSESHADDDNQHDLQQIYDGTGRPPGIVQICDAVCESRPEMQKGQCRLPSHSPVPIGRASANSSKRHRIERISPCESSVDKMHFRGARVSETNLNSFFR